MLGQVRKCFLKYMPPFSEKLIAVAMKKLNSRIEYLHQVTYVQFIVRWQTFPALRIMRCWKRLKILDWGWWMVHMIVQLPLSARARSCEQSDKDVMLSKPAWANPADRIKLAMITVPFSCIWRNMRFKPLIKAWSFSLKPLNTEFMECWNKELRNRYTNCAPPVTLYTIWGFSSTSLRLSWGLWFKGVS